MRPFGGAVEARQAQLHAVLVITELGAALRKVAAARTDISAMEIIRGQRLKWGPDNAMDDRTCPNKALSKHPGESVTHPRKQRSTFGWANQTRESSPCAASGGRIIPLDLGGQRSRPVTR